MASDWFEDGDLAVDLRGCRVWLKGQEVSVSALRFRILCCLIENAGRPLASREIMRYAWEEYQYDVGLVRWHISRLRRELEDVPPKRIVYVRGFGYRYDRATPPAWEVGRTGPKRGKLCYSPRDRETERRRITPSHRVNGAPALVPSDRCHQVYS